LVKLKEQKRTTINVERGGVEQVNMMERVDDKIEFFEHRKERNWLLFILFF